MANIKLYGFLCFLLSSMLLSFVVEAKELKIVPQIDFDELQKEKDTSFYQVEEDLYKVICADLIPLENSPKPKKDN